jgi:hypothetical protein
MNQKERTEFHEKRLQIGLSQTQKTRPQNCYEFGERWERVELWDPFLNFLSIRSIAVSIGLCLSLMLSRLACPFSNFSNREKSCLASRSCFRKSLNGIDQFCSPSCLPLCLPCTRHPSVAPEGKIVSVAGKRTDTEKKIRLVMGRMQTQKNHLSCRVFRVIVMGKGERKQKRKIVTEGF